MILCLTPNPAIDRTLIVPNLSLGYVHRAEQIIIAAGGKGFNVARTIRTLGSEPLCIGFAGGHTGHLLADLAEREGLHSSWTWTNVETRTCTILVSPSGDATVINEPGMPISKSDWERLRQDLRKHISSTNLVCISGSFPPDCSVEDLQEVFKMLADTAKQIWVDTSGTALEVVLTYPGVNVKVNGDEISKSVGFEVKDITSAKRALTMLVERGQPACVITLGAAGALLATREGKWHAQGPRVRVVSTVGSGDAFLGGLVSALDRGKEWPAALGDAVAAGTANVLSAGGGRFTLDEFKELRAQIQIEAW